MFTRPGNHPSGIQKIMEIKTVSIESDLNLEKNWRWIATRMMIEQQDISDCLEMEVLLSIYDHRIMIMIKQRLKIGHPILKQAQC